MRPAVVTALLGLVLALTAATFDAEPLYVPAAAFVILAVGAVAWVHLGSRRLEIARTVSARRVLEDDTVRIDIRVRTRSLALPAGADRGPAAARAGGDRGGPPDGARRDRRAVRPARAQAPRRAERHRPRPVRARHAGRPGRGRGRGPRPAADREGRHAVGRGRRHRPRRAPRAPVDRGRGRPRRPAPAPARRARVAHVLAGARPQRGARRAPAARRHRHAAARRPRPARRRGRRAARRRRPRRRLARRPHGQGRRLRAAASRATGGRPCSSRRSPRGSTRTRASPS